MKPGSKGCLLRIFIGEADRWEGKPLYEAIVLKARQEHLAGATVLRGILGFGAHTRLHSAKLLEVSLDLPLVIEIIDEEAAIRAFVPQVQAMVTSGLVTVESLQVLHYGSASDAGGKRSVE